MAALSARALRNITRQLSEHCFASARAFSSQEVIKPTEEFCDKPAFDEEEQKRRKACPIQSTAQHISSKGSHQDLSNISEMRAATPHTRSHAPALSALVTARLSWLRLPHTQHGTLPHLVQLTACNAENGCACRLWTS